MKLIFDFDDVLLNTKGFKKVMCDQLRKEGIENGEELYEMERQKGQAFTLKNFLISAISAQSGHGVPSENIGILYEEIMGHCKELVNRELVNVIKATGKENCYIVSNGDQEFQEDKIARTELEELVKKVIIVPGTKSLEIEKICNEFPDEKILFIDDKSIYFNDINQEVAKNLTTILYKGSESLTEIKKQIEVTQPQEPQKVLFGGPLMR